MVSVVRADTGLADAQVTSLLHRLRHAHEDAPAPTADQVEALLTAHVGDGASRQVQRRVALTRAGARMGDPPPGDLFAAAAELPDAARAAAGALTAHLNGTADAFRAAYAEATPRQRQTTRLAAPREWRQAFKESHPDLPHDRASLYAFWKVETGGGASSDAGPTLVRLGRQLRCTRCGRFSNRDGRHNCLVVTSEYVTSNGVRLVVRDGTVYATDGRRAVKAQLGDGNRVELSSGGFPVRSTQADSFPSTRIGNLLNGFRREDTTAEQIDQAPPTVRIVGSVNKDIRCQRCGRWLPGDSEHECGDGDLAARAAEMAEVGRSPAADLPDGWLDRPAADRWREVLSDPGGPTGDTLALWFTRAELTTEALGEASAALGDDTLAAAMRARVPRPGRGRARFRLRCDRCGRFARGADHVCPPWAVESRLLPDQVPDGDDAVSALAAAVAPGDTVVARLDATHARFLVGRDDDGRFGVVLANPGAFPSRSDKVQLRAKAMATELALNGEQGPPLVIVSREEALAGFGASIEVMRSHYRDASESRQRLLDLHVERPFDPDEFAQYVAEIPAGGSGRWRVPFSEDPAMDGLGAQEPGGRTFGVELEYTGCGEHEVRRDLEDIGYIGYIRHTASGQEHTGWAFTPDGTVDAELVSPVLWDTPDHWRQIDTACRVIRDHGGEGGRRAGSHMSVGVGDFGNDPAPYARLLRLVWGYEDVLYRLASSPYRGTWRGGWSSPIGRPQDSYQSVADARSRYNSHSIGLNLENVGGRHSDRVEFRMWDATIDPGVVRAQAVCSVGLTAAALRGVEAPGGGQHRMGHHASLAPGADDTAAFREMVALCYGGEQPRRILTQLFAATRWQSGTRR